MKSGNGWAYRLSGKLDPLSSLFSLSSQGGLPPLRVSRKERERLSSLFSHPQSRLSAARASSRKLTLPPSPAKKAKEAKKARGSQDQLPDLPRPPAGLFDGAPDLALALKQEERRVDL